MYYSMDIFSVKQQDMYSREVADDIRMILFSKDKTILPLVGSFALVVQKYPSDIDVHELYYDSDLHDSVYDTLLLTLNEIIERIRYDPNFVFSEFKAGVDKRYDIDVGTMIDGVYTPDEDLMDNIKKLSDNGLIRGEEYLFIKKLLTVSNRSDSYIHDYIVDLLDEYKTVRWSINEIKAGFTILPANKRLNLRDAIRQKGVVKIDVFTIVDDKVMEMSNFLVLAKKSDNKMTSLNLNISLSPSGSLTKMGLLEAAERIRGDVDMYLNSEGNHNVFKAIKRMFSLTRLYYLMFGNRSYLQFGHELVPILNSWISSLYQISGEISNIGGSLDKCDNCPTGKMRECIMNIRSRIQDMELWDYVKTTMIKHIDESLKLDVIHMDHLYMLQDIIDKITNRESTDFLNSIHVPSYVYPKDRMYSEQLKYTVNI